MAEIFKVDLTDNQVEYSVFGNGSKTFVIIPGLSIIPVLKSADFVKAQYSEFENEYTIYLFDRPSVLPVGCTIESIADIMAAAIIKLGLKDIYLFSTSQGAMIAQYIAAKHPSLIKKLILASTLSKENETCEKVVAGWKQLAETGEIHQLYDDMFSKIYTPAMYEKAKKAVGYFADMTTASDIERFITLCNACNGFNVTPLLDNIVCPTLIIAAENDTVVTPDASEYTTKIKNSCLFTYKGYSHAVYDEAEDYKDRIRCFFENDGEVK